MIKFDKKLVKMTAFGRDITVTNNVRNELNGLRRPNEIVYTEKQDGSKGLPYYPRQFPVGKWVVTSITPKPQTEPYLFPYFIGTSAHQLVPTWSVKDGKYDKPAGQAEDYGYGIHTSSSSTTLGCIKVTKMDDLLWLVDQIRKVQATGAVVTLEVV